MAQFIPFFKTTTLLRCSLSVLFVLGTLSACNQDKTLRLHGKMESVEHLGYTCWVFRDDNGRSYEVVTPSTQILKDGLAMNIIAEPSGIKTICELGDNIEIIKYRPDSPAREQQLPNTPAEKLIKMQ